MYIMKKIILKHFKKNCFVSLNPQRISSISDIPNNLTINTYEIPSKSKIVLLGVERYNPVHCSFVHDFLQTFQPNTVLVPLPCDHPIFIKCTDSFDVTWKKFLAGKFDIQFLINPHPNTISEIIMEELRIKQFIERNVDSSPNDFAVGPYTIYTKKPYSTDEMFLPDIFFLPFLFSYQNSIYKMSVIPYEKSIIQERERIVREMNKKLFVQILEDEGLVADNSKKKADYRVIHPNLFVKDRVEYQMEVLKQATLFNEKIVVLCENYESTFLDAGWRKLEPKIKSLKNLLTNPPAQNSELLYFSDFIQRHIMLEFLLEPFIQKYFINYKIFPFKFDHVIGANIVLDSTFVVWNHYYYGIFNMINKKSGNQVTQNTVQNELILMNSQKTNNL